MLCKNKKQGSTCWMPTKIQSGTVCSLPDNQIQKASVMLDPSFPSAPLWFHLEPLGVLSSAAALQHKNQTTLSQWTLQEGGIE